MWQSLIGIQRGKWAVWGKFKRRFFLILAGRIFWGWPFTGTKVTVCFFVVKLLSWSSWGNRGCYQGSFSSEIQTRRPLAKEPEDLDSRPRWSLIEWVISLHQFIICILKGRDHTECQIADPWAKSNPWLCFLWPTNYYKDFLSCMPLGRVCIHQPAASPLYAV